MSQIAHNFSATWTGASKGKKGVSEMGIGVVHFYIHQIKWWALAMVLLGHQIL